MHVEHDRDLEVSLGSMRIERGTRRHLVASLASVQEPIHHGLDLIIAHQPGLRFRTSKRCETSASVGSYPLDSNHQRMLERPDM